MFLLTRDEIEKVCDEIEGYIRAGAKIHAIRAVYNSLSFGLREAKDFVDTNWLNLPAVVRKELEEKAGLCGIDLALPQVFENEHFRLQVKGEATLESLQRFFLEVVNVLFKE